MDAAVKHVERKKKETTTTKNRFGRDSRSHESRLEYLGERFLLAPLTFYCASDLESAVGAEQ